MCPARNENSGNRRKLWLVTVILFSILLLLFFVYFPDGDVNFVESKPGSRWEIGPDTLVLEIPPGELRKIQVAREAAISRGIITGDFQSPAAGFIIEEGGKIPVTFKLKGDWTDHIRNDKWSLRIQLQSPDSWKRMSEFSIQDPATRNYLNEWLYHRFLHENDILTTRYDFVIVILNGKEMGTFAIEEYFSAALAEFNRRPPGSLLRFSEQAVWAARSDELSNGLDLAEFYDFYGLSLPIPISSGAISNIALAIQEEGMALLHQYKTGSLPMEEVFILEKAAKLQAVNDLFRAYHSMIWHNLRFYYNPRCELLEQIAYDGYSSTEQIEYVRHAFAGFARNGNHVRYDSTSAPGEFLFESDEFMKYYYEYLVQMTDSANLETFLSSCGEAIRIREKLIRKDKWFYKFDLSSIRSSAKRIRLSLASAAKYRMTIQRISNERFRIKNHAPLALEILADGNPVEFLHAWDKHFPPDSADISISVTSFPRIETRVPGSHLLQLLSLPEAAE